MPKLNISLKAESDKPEKELRAQARNALSNALDEHRKGQQVYQSLKNLGEVIGTEYGDRVLFELIQNAHDAHAIGDIGGIAIKLEVNSEMGAPLPVQFAEIGGGVR